MFHQFPYTNFHEINLDWIIQKVKEAYSPDNPPENIVLSVNGQTGDVVLYEGALVELPAIPENDMWQIRRNTQGNINRGIAFAGNGRAYIIEGSENHQIYDAKNPPPYPVTSVNSATGAVILYQNPSVIFPEVEDTSWRIFRNAGGTTLGIRFTNGKIYRINSTDNFEMYDAGNPPPYPVTSVNGQTGAVNIKFPVTSVNGQTGAVNLQIPFVNTAPEILELQTDSPGDYWGMKRTTTNGDVGIYFDSENNTVKAYITYMPEDESTGQLQTFQLLTTDDIPSSSGVVSVNGKTGAVVIRATDIPRTENNAETVETALTRIDQKNSTQDNAISALQGDISKIHQSIAIIADGDTHTAIQAGHAVFVKNHSTLATGLYWANSAIGTDAALTTSNLTADTSGGLNHLQNEVATLKSKITKVNSNANATRDIISDALACTETTFFWGVGSSYTGTLPNDYYKYGTFIVNVRGTNRYVIAHAEDDELAVNAYNGLSWSGWRELISLTNIALSSNTRVDLPFTAPHAGILRIALRAQAQGRVYMTFSGGEMIDGYQEAGGYVFSEIPIPKGKTLTSIGQSNVSESLYDWYAFNF